ncbi:hypothetical protein AB6A40_004940 [Gnathostoma spinigerum]|uniref:GTPase Era, mitochondrial n=1 Tax=Gnathostoma spinigerum TaxID=75299 RepID=A0ABD6EEZ7_9BILA
MECYQRFTSLVLFHSKRCKSKEILFSRWPFLIRSQYFSEHTHSFRPSSHNENPQRSLRVAVVGPPNSGKSSLTNQLVSAQVSAVSSRMDTTQRNVVAAVTVENRQLVFVDSPGTVSIQHARNIVKDKCDRILMDPERAVERADYIIVLHDATATGDYIHHRVLHLLHRYQHLPSSLVINKVDLVKRRCDLLPLINILCNGQVGGQKVQLSKARVGRLGQLGAAGHRSKDSLNPNELDSIRDQYWQEKYRNVMQKPIEKVSWSETKHLFINIRGWSKFDAVFLTSSCSGEGIESLKEHLLNQSIVREHTFTSSTVTTKNPQAICQDAVRAKLLDNLPADVAYRLQV